VNIYKKSTWFVFLLSCICFLALSACNTDATPSVTPTPEPTATATATATPLPTPTPTPTPDPATFVEEAEAKFWQSDLEGAVALYQKALDVQPDYAPAYVGLSILETWRLPMEDETNLSYAQKAVEAAPEDAMAHAVLAHVYTEKEKVTEALEAARKATDLDPQNAYAQAVLSQAYLLDRRYEEAQKAAEAAYDLDPESVYTLYALADVYMKTADFPRARAIYEQTVALKPAFYGTHDTLAWFWLQRERYDAAEAAFNKALELAPQSLNTMLGLARIYVARHDYESAEAWLEKAEALELGKKSVYLERGYLYSQQEEYDKALEQLNQALKLLPDDYDTRMAIGSTYLDKDECSRAEREFQSLTEAQPRFADAYIGLGYAKLCADDATKALTYFRKALELEPYSAWPHQGMGTAYAMQERWEESDAAYVEAIRFSPAPASLHIRLGQSYLNRDKTDEAEAEYKLAAALDPYSQEALLGLTQILLNQYQEAEALTTVQDAVALDASNKKAQYFLGLLTVLQGEPENGAAILEDLLDKEPEETYAHYFLGIAYTEMGRYRDAKKELETFQALSGSQQGYTLQNLIAALDKGFKLSDDKAIEQMLEFFDQFIDVKPEIVIGETGDATRAMTITIPLTAEDLKADNQMALYRDIGIVAAIVGLRVPQIDPPVEGGVLMLYTRSGKPQFTVYSSLENLKRFFYGWLDGEQFVTSLEYSRWLASGSQTSLREIERQIAEVRELDFEAAVPSEMITKDDLRAHISEGIDHQEHEALKNDEAMLELLGLIDPALDLEEVLVDVQTEQTAGFYTLEEDKFYVLETEEQTAADQTVIAHEYVHALQDQHFDLAALDDAESDDDRRLAFRALLEGDATLATLLYANEHVLAIDLLNLMTSVGGVEDEVLETTPMFIQETLAFPYAAGLEFVSALHDRGGWEEVNAAYEAPPQSTEQILHPERYWDKDAPVEVSLSDLASKLGSAWKELDNDVMGELGLRLTLATHVGPAVAAKASEGWGGDRYVLLQTGDAYVTALKMTWDSEKEATEFFRLYRAMVEHRSDFVQDVPSLVGEIDEYWWSAENNCIYATQKSEQVILLVGTNRDVVAQVLSVMQ